MLASSIAAALVPILSGCGGANGQLNVTVTDTHCSRPPCAYKPGDTPEFRVSVANRGPGDASGVQVRVNMPSTFQYKSAQIGGNGNARTQPADAQVGVSDPNWGLWNLAAPTPGADDPYAHVDITFKAAVAGAPKTYNMVGSAEGDNTSGIIASQPLPVVLEPAPQLSLTATVQPASLKSGQSATYKVTITNSGDGIAGGVALLITLPPVLAFQQSVTPFGGNASRNNPIDPTKGSEEVFYAGFTIPPGSNAGPGFLSIVFKALVVVEPPAGTYSLSVQLNDDGGDVVSLVNAAPVTVIASPKPSPSPSPSPTPEPSPTPGQ